MTNIRATAGSFPPVPRRAKIPFIKVPTAAAKDAIIIITIKLFPDFLAITSPVTKIYTALLTVQTKNKITSFQITI